CAERDVFEGERENFHPRAVRVSADAPCVIVDDETADRIAAVESVVLIAQQDQSEPIRPTFAHAAALRASQTGRIADQTVARAVSQFVKDYVLIEIAVTHRRAGPKIHLHAP